MVNEIDTRIITKLRSLYFNKSIHANYHPVFDWLTPYFPEIKVNKKWRDVNPRIALLKKELSFNKQAEYVVEIGSNVGFQLINLARIFPHLKFIGYEIEKSFVEFSQICLELLSLKNVEILNETFNEKTNLINKNTTIILDFNVVHHAGKDFMQDQIQSIEDWWSIALPGWLKNLNSFQNYWFSSGFRLGGNTQLNLHNPIDPAGFIKKLEERLPDGIKEVESIFTINCESDSLTYLKTERNLNVNNIIDLTYKKANLIGEYFRRPILKIK